MLRFRPILADHELTEQQWRVLRALSNADRPVDVGELADTTFLLGPSLSRILSNLDQRSLINRRADPSDQRRSMISLAAKGRRLVARIAPKSENEYAEIERLLGPDKLRELLGLLAELSATSPTTIESTEELAS